MTRLARICNLVSLVASLITLTGAFILALAGFAGCMEPPLAWKHETFDAGVHLSSGIDFVSESLDPVRQAAEESIRQNRQR